MRIIKLILIVIGAFLSAILFGQSGREKTGSLLWKISGNGLNKSSYVLGTLHLESGNYLDSIPGANDAFNSCEQIIGEVVMTDMASIIAKTQPFTMMKLDTTYHMLYSEEDYNFVNEQLKSFFSVGLDHMGILKPMAINSTLAIFIGAKLIPNFNPQNQLDISIQQKAVEKGKPVMGLEDVEFQAALLFGSTGLQRQADLLLCALKNQDMIGGQLKDLINSYHKADLIAIDKMVNNQDLPCSNTTEEMEALNKTRNDKWMSTLPEIMKDKSSFIAVGAMHLIGEEGLLNQLEKLGYTIEAVIL